MSGNLALFKRVRSPASDNDVDYERRTEQLSTTTKPSGGDRLAGPSGGGRRHLRRDSLAEFRLGSRQLVGDL